METQEQKKIPKYWGWQDGIFGKPLPKYKFKSGYVPDLKLPPPKGLEGTTGYWYCGKYVVIKNAPETKKAQRAAPEVKVSRPELKKETKIKKTYFNNNIFIGKLEAGMYNNIGKSIQNPTILLLYLLQHGPWQGKQDKHHTWDKWYCKKHLIVVSISIEKMAVDLGVTKKTIKNWLKALEADNYIVKRKEGRENIYILGEVIGQDKLYLYSSGTTKQKVERMLKNG